MLLSQLKYLSFCLLSEINRNYRLRLLSEIMDKKTKKILKKLEYQITLSFSQINRLKMLSTFHTYDNFDDV